LALALLLFPRCILRRIILAFVGKMSRPIVGGTVVAIWDKEWTVLTKEPDGNHLHIKLNGVNDVRRRVKVQEVRRITIAPQYS